MDTGFSIRIGDDFLLDGPFEADYFGSDRSWQLKPFSARFGCGESEGVDAFAVRWDREFGSFHPPVGLITKVVRRAEKKGSSGVLVTPDWPGSVYLMLVEEKVREGTMVLRKKFSPRIECPREIISDTFRGRLKFFMNLYEFDFK